MDSISQTEIQYLKNNNNTGIEFEYALFYLLNSEKKRNAFMNDIIIYHEFRDRILKIISETDISLLNQSLNFHSWLNFDPLLATQVDNIGPADIVLRKENSQDLGLSIKYQNNCTLNVSSKYFLSIDSVIKLKNELHSACENYINEMNSTFGSVNNWFRQRKNSIETEKYIDRIRDFVINDWNNKTTKEKKELLSKLVHADSPINFWVVKFVNTKNGFNLEIKTNPVKTILPESVTLTKEATSFIGFKSNNIMFAKMQVKFNNGIIEKQKGNKYDFVNEGIGMKKGDPFGSWNFSI